jgi:N-methylhydantoinase A
MSAWRVGVDIGGTFTDAAFVDTATGAVRIVKVPTTPTDPARGFMTVVERGLRDLEARGGDVSLVVHATTVATNALIEGKTARVGLLVTRGFRDILEIGRQIRSRLYDVHLQKPAPLVERRASLEVRERLDADGRVLEPLDLTEVHAAAGRLKHLGAEAVVICFLHSYLNPAHERAAAAVVRKELPGAFLSVSSEVCPEFREYLRASTAAVNAAVMPIVSGYLDALEGRLAALGVAAPFYVMQSSGGVMSSASAKERPVYMVESGPAAGVIAAGAFAEPHGSRNVISFDMGGTTAKVGLIQDGRLRLSTEMEVGAHAVTPLGEGRGSGYPVRTPVIDLVEVGAGGGSEAWIDAGGALRVGPRSAGAAPGPACYGQGGTAPTITDANLVLSRLNPEFFLGGAIRRSGISARGPSSGSARNKSRQLNHGVHQTGARPSIMAKKIVLCFDGTWNTPGDTASPAEDNSTNVFRFYDRVSAQSDQGVQQVKWYNQGVGTE